MASNKTGSLALEVLPMALSIARLQPDADLPAWASGAWYAVIRTEDELSIVCESRLVPNDVQHNGPWRALKVEGLLDFGLTGILSRIARPLADAGLSIFAVSTFDTDYVLVRREALDDAVSSLRKAGMIVHHGD